MDELTFNVGGMHCKSCVMLIEDELGDLGATRVVVTLDDRTKTGRVSLATDKPRSVIIRAIESLGDYRVLSQ